MMTTQCAFATFLLIGGAALAAQPQPALRVVVIEGEDAINIIQQKTAVRPIVEVRDRNNLPVAGALVTFSIEGGKAASFAGASTLTMATNAAGQAAVTGLTPTAAGAFQIQVSAAFQGQIATATIAQTNVLTAAQAAAAGAATSSGTVTGSAAGGAAASGAAGGLSATTIAIAGAAVAGGAAAAVQVAGSEKPEASKSSTFTGSFGGPLLSTSASGPNGSIVCTINRVVAGNLTLTLDTETATAVAGPLRATGTDTVTSSTCAVASRNTQFDEQFTVSGTPQRLGFDETRREQRQESVGFLDQNRRIVFEGVLNGNTITGTLKVEERGTITGGPGGTANEATSGSFAVTMTRS